MGSEVNQLLLVESNRMDGEIETRASKRIFNRE